MERLNTLPRVPLAILPTPLLPARRLSALLEGPQIWFKRDDLTGFGMGGNKVRQLEFLAGDALAQEADILITGAGPQSNHVRTTIALAAHLGLQHRVVLYGDPPQEVQGNYLLDQILGAEMVFTGSPDRAELDARIPAEAERLRTLGFRPYVISRGGASPLGCLGYVVAALELSAQLQQLQIKPDYVILATGSCGTQAGLLVGSKCLKLDYCLWGMTVSRPRQECIERIENLSAAATELLELDCTVGTEDVMVNEDYIGDGYGEVTQEGIEAIQWVARTEGIFLDPVYTGKAMAGLIDLIRQGKIGPKDTVVFLHTGGSPALFAHASRFLINSADQTPK